jgi:hypothetical protein
VHFDTGIRQSASSPPDYKIRERFFLSFLQSSFIFTCCHYNSSGKYQHATTLVKISVSLCWFFHEEIKKLRNNYFLANKKSLDSRIFIIPAINRMSK